MENENIFYATGKRKSSVAKVWLKLGSGKITVNNKNVNDYFVEKHSRHLVFAPLNLTNKDKAFDVMVKVSGGGFSGQVGAVKHGLSKALEAFDPELRSVLKGAGFLTRDARRKERKKYGQKGARASYQFSKR